MRVSYQEEILVANVFKYIFVGFFLDWIKDGMKEDHNVILSELYVAIGGEMERMLRRFEKEEPSL